MLVSNNVCMYEPVRATHIDWNDVWNGPGVFLVWEVPPPATETLKLPEGVLNQHLMIYDILVLTTKCIEKAIKVN